MIPKDYIKKKSKTIPFGYEVSEFEGWLRPIQSQLFVLNKYIKQVKEGSLSLREASELISSETKRKLSHVGLSKLVQKNKGGRPKGSKSNYNYSATQKRKQLVAREAKKLAKEKEKLQRREEKIKKEKEVLTKTTEIKNNKVVIDSELEQVAPSIQEIIKDNNVIFHPNEGPQTKFLAADE